MANTVRKELGSQANIRSLSDLDNIDPNEQIVVIGTLFKTQNLKPNILKEVGEENAITHEEVRTRKLLCTYIFHQIKNLSNDSIPFLHPDISRFFKTFLILRLKKDPFLINKLTKLMNSYLRTSYREQGCISQRRTLI